MERGGMRHEANSLTNFMKPTHLILGETSGAGWVFWGPLFMVVLVQHLDLNAVKQTQNKYTPGASNIAVAGKWTRIEDVFPIKMDKWVYSIAMLVYQRGVNRTLRSIQLPSTFLCLDGFIGDSLILKHQSCSHVFQIELTEVCHHVVFFQQPASHCPGFQSL